MASNSGGRIACASTSSRWILSRSLSCAVKMAQNAQSLKEFSVQFSWGLSTGYPWLMKSFSSIVFSSFFLALKFTWCSHSIIRWSLNKSMLQGPSKEANLSKQLFSSLCICLKSAARHPSTSQRPWDLFLGSPGWSRWDGECPDLLQPYRQAPGRYRFTSQKRRPRGIAGLLHASLMFLYCGTLAMTTHWFTWWV